MDESPAEPTEPDTPDLPIVIDVPGGRRLTVRAMAERDVDGIMLLYEGLSGDDRSRRFFSSFEPHRSFVELWIHRTRRHGFGLVAVLDDDQPSARLVGEAGYVLVPDGDGEFAITIAHDWRGWLGPYLLDLLVAAATARGVPNRAGQVDRPASQPPWLIGGPATRGVRAHVGARSRADANI